MYTELKELYKNEAILEEFSDTKLLTSLLLNRQLSKKEVSVTKFDVLEPHQTKETIYFVISGGLIEVTENKFTYLVNKGEFINLNAGIMKESSDIQLSFIENTKLLAFERNEVLNYLLNTQEGWMFLLVEERRKTELVLNGCTILKKKGVKRLELALNYLAKSNGSIQDDGYLLPKSITIGFLTRYVNLSHSSVKYFIGQLKEEGKLKIIHRQFLVCKQ